MNDTQRAETPAYIARCRCCNEVIAAQVDDNTHWGELADFAYEFLNNGFVLERTTVGEARTLFGACTCPEEPPL